MMWACCIEYCDVERWCGLVNVWNIFILFFRSIQFQPAQTSIQHKSPQRILLRVHSKAPKPMHFHVLQLSLRHQDLTSDDSFEKSTITETLDEEDEYDVLTYTTVR